MKKTALVLAAVLLLLLCLCACGAGREAEAVTFRNDLGVKVNGFYISPTESDGWGEPLNYAPVNPGSRVTIDAEKLPDGFGVYDVGAVDADGILYELYEVKVEKGLTIALSFEDGRAWFSFAAADGTVARVEGYYVSTAE
jgi:hypothetical protein